MSQLVPCLGCGRHVRLTSATCPFCDVALDVAALNERYAPRRTGVAGGIKRAAVFALGAGMAAACGGESEAEVGPNPGTTQSSESSVSNDSESEDMTSEPLAQPLYGAPIPSELTRDTDSTSDPLAQPVYGAPITDVPTTEVAPTSDVAVQPLYGAPVTDFEPDGGVSSSEGVDGGVTADAGELTDGQPSEPLVVPLYGSPPTRR
jgi:hypothetical protein